MKKYKAIIYDIDGTLLNTVDQNMYPLIRIIKEELNEDWTYEQVVPFTANPGMRTLQILGIQDIDTVYARWVRYVNEYGPGAQPYEGIEALLDAAGEKGLKQGIVSSKRQKQYGIDMGRHGYDKRMDAAVLFEDTPVHKPDPEPMFECLRRLGWRPRTPSTWAMPGPTWWPPGPPVWISPTPPGAASSPWSAANRTTTWIIPRI